MRYLLVLSALPFLLTITACSGTAMKTIKTKGCGGITGGCRGYEIHSDGTVFQTQIELRDFGPKEKKTEICKDRKIADLLFEKLKMIKFTDIHMKEVENITAYISFESEGRRHEVSWWQKNESTKPLDDFWEEELRLLRESNCLREPR